MMIHLKLGEKGYPKQLSYIPGAPKQLFVIGHSLHELCEQFCLAIVGSRKVTAYGRQVTEKLASELARAGLVVVSGLALGVDAVAHQAALSAGGKTIAVLPTGLDTIYPPSHHYLARQILEQGGALVTEYPERTEAFPSNFVARNRIISGLSRGVLITEAAEKSGSLHTANFALEQGREVMAVPGSITSPTSAGTNNLIKTGATPVTITRDVLETLGVEPVVLNKATAVGLSEPERAIVGLLEQGIKDGSELLAISGLEAAVFSQTLTLLEINGQIKTVGSGAWALV